MTWNLQGNCGLDVDAAVRVIGADCDLVLLQEVQPAQLRALARALDIPYRHWSFKHWGFPTAPEGLGVLSRHSMRVRTRTLTRGVWPWQWQRRIMQRIRIDGLTFVNTHLATNHTGQHERVMQIGRLIAASPGPDYIGGDLNERRGGVLDALKALAMRDAWTDCNGALECFTNWSTSDRTGPPDQRLDWIWLGTRLEASSVRLVEWQRTAELSDHVPLVVELRRTD